MISKLKVMVIFGTRPEAIKMVPLIKELKKHSDFIDSYVTVTAQHREMLDQVLNVFDIVPDFDLNIMKDRQSLLDITNNASSGLDKIYKEVQPDLVLVHGDTTTTYAASIAAFYNKIQIGHVEAGLRTNNKYSPYPEEMNRQLTGVLADFHFAPTEASKINLLKENKNAENIFVTGNTAIDALQTTVSSTYSHEILEQIGTNRMILLTAHRRENFGQPMINIFNAINRITKEHQDVEVVYPVHLNPLVKDLASDLLGNNPKVHLIEPLQVIDFHNFASKAYMILTDSGGVQEEAPSLGKPVLVLRDTTERPEGIQAGTLKLAGTDENEVYNMAHDLLTDTNMYETMSKSANPYGDGHASKRIVDAILYSFDMLSEMVPEFHYDLVTKIRK